MELTSVLKALGSLSLFLANSAPAVSENFSPAIIGPEHIQIKAQPGQSLILHCEAVTNSEHDVTLLYWLINGSFPEDIPSNDRITELETATFLDGAIEQRSLLLKNVIFEDLGATFTCVVMNSFGMAYKNVTLTAKTDDCYALKKTPI
ncbi:interleukin-1 receptor accessory protein-like isoform X1 [Entelurus aequoreus]|uniref:interleukin-1 receptor accessory protein-like isoform X1 n=1 Tax=Entelurus aequoreus TaxID=161455 RepID=UPI002B1D36D9|nr:interleukin-1 receptor accessory protein-like isoform X1 [Entelurus aequoreus]